MHVTACPDEVHSTTFERMAEDMDINSGDILDRGVTIEEKSEETFQAVPRVASGEPTKSETLGMGDNEFTLADRRGDVSVGLLPVQRRLITRLAERSPGSCGPAG